VVNSSHILGGHPSIFQVASSSYFPIGSSSLL
jgi:hypothetical protein